MSGGARASALFRGDLLRATVAILPLVGFLAGCASQTVSPAPPSPVPPRSVTSRSSAAKPPRTAALEDRKPADAAGLADLWARASNAREEGRHEDAVALWESLWSADPAYEGVADLLEEEYRVRGLDAFARGRTEEAVALWRKALRIDPADRKTQAYLAHAEAQQARLGNITGAPNPTP